MMMTWIKAFASQCLLSAVFIGVGAVFFASSAEAAELASPRDPFFYDRNDTPYLLEGELEFLPAADQSDITDYAIYVLDHTDNKIKLLGSVNVKQQEEYIAYAKSIGLKRERYMFRIKDLEIAKNAEKFGIYAKNALEESTAGLIMPIWDRPRHRFQEGLRITDKNPSQGNLELALTWKGLQEENPITGYKVYFWVDGQKKALSSKSIDVAKGKSEYELIVPSGTIPERTEEMAIYPVSPEGINGPGLINYVMDDISEEPIVQLQTSSLIPAPVITEIGDRDSVVGTFSGSIRWEVDDREFTGMVNGASPLSYAVYFLDKDKRKIKGIGMIPRNTSRYGDYTLQIPSGTPIPEEAVYLGVFAQMSTAEGIQFGEKFFWDKPYDRFQPKRVQFIDMDENPGSIQGKVTWQAADDEGPLYGYAIHIDWQRKDAKPYTIVEKGRASYEYVFPDGAVPNQGNLVYVLPVNEFGEVPSDSYDHRRPETFATIADSTASQKATLEPTGINLGNFTQVGFQDMDGKPGVIGGRLNYSNKYGDTVAIEFFYVDALNRKLMSINDIQCTANRCGYSYLDIPEGTPIPDGALHIGVRAKLKDGTVKPIGAAVLKDNSTEQQVSFTDVHTEFNHAGQQEVEQMASLGLVTGYADGSFGPDKPITRAEFAVILVRSLRLAPTLNEAAPFSDVSSDDWFAKPVATAVEYKLLSGFEDGTFRPQQNVTRAEMAVMVYKAYLIRYARHESKAYIEYEDNYLIPEWAQDSVSGTKQLRLIPKYNKLEPNKPATRMECTVSLYRLMQAYFLVDRINN